LIREIAAKTGIPSSTIWDVFTTRLGDVWRKCRLVLQNLTEEQQEQGLTQSRAPLMVLQRAKALAWCFLSTRDESWFFYSTPHQRLWISWDAETPEVARRVIYTPNLMVTILRMLPVFT
jgi:hypothetical protein